MKSQKPIMLTTFLVILLGIFISSNAFARHNYDPNYTEYPVAIGKINDLTSPNVQALLHDVGLIGLAVTNQGQIGTGFTSLGNSAPSCRYPITSNQEYLFAGALWIGAVVGRDTLVSIGADGWSTGLTEMWPEIGDDPPPYGGAMQTFSISNDADIGIAKSEQDIIAVYTDTVTDPGLVANDPTDNRPHIPLNLEITQRSYAWSYKYAEDFVLFDYSIKNIGRKEQTNVYMGLYVDCDIAVSGDGATGSADDLSGFLETAQTVFTGPNSECVFTDTINIAWTADNNGRSDNGEAVSCEYPHVTGVKLVRTPADSLDYSFNWWVSNQQGPLDWGPRKKGTPEDPFRDFGGFKGTPEGDKNKYYIMRHKEFDYDQLFSGIDHTADGWEEADPRKCDFADGFDTRFLFSFGPFNISPGEVLPITYCYVAGKDLHTGDCSSFEALQNTICPNPELYYSTFDFSDFKENAQWASWIYDNPGRDTDGDKDFGKYKVCCYDSGYVYVYDEVDPNLIVDSNYVVKCDTLWTEGDGIPDFEGASPPPPPELWIVDTTGDTLGTKVIPRVVDSEGQFIIRWNGFESETTPDNFARDPNTQLPMVDFEGYNVYGSFTPSYDGFGLLTSYDIENYNRYIFDTSNGTWSIKDFPFSPEDLEAIYGNSPDWQGPEYHSSVENAITFNGVAYYFKPQFYNRSDLLDPNGIHKLYPDAEKPPEGLLPDSARVDSLSHLLTDDGLFFKYYEYEYNLGNLLPSQLYYISVTAFDFGSPVSGLEPLETPRNKNIIADYPQNSASQVESEGLNVAVYPNPYRADGNYRSNGFEGRDYVVYNNFTDSLVRQEDFNEDRIHSIHFSNLPHKCTIRIFTIDGDLVREIEHESAPGAPQSGHERWDMITRNTQLIVSGIYYYSVESEFGNQVGKLVIIF